MSSMNPSYWEDLVASTSFSKLSKLKHTFILEKIVGPSPVKTMNNGGDVSFEGAALEVVSMEAPTPTTTTPRSPRSKPTPVREIQTTKPNKDKQKNLVPVREFPRKHSVAHNQKKVK